MEFSEAFDVDAAVSGALGDPDEWTMTDALGALKQIRRTRLEVDEQLRAAEQEGARIAFVSGARWGDLAAAAGVTRQTAQATYRDRENRPRRQPTREEPQVIPTGRRVRSFRDEESWADAFDGD